MERSAVRGPLHKHLDLERKMAKQAEARLHQQLRSLEDVCLYHLKLLSREQRQLQREQQRLQQDIAKVRLSSSLGNGTEKRPGVLSFPPQGGQKPRPPKHEVRALATNTTQDVNKIKSQMLPLCYAGLKNPTRRKEHWPPQSYRTASFVAEKPQAQEKESVVPPQGMDPDEGFSVAHQDPAVSSSTAEHGFGSHTTSGSGTVPVDETRSNDANLEPVRSTVEHTPPGSMECETTKSALSELFAKAKNAHYLRHRVPPESERLLSIREIFGCGESSPEGQKRIVEMVPSKCPPL